MTTISKLHCFIPMFKDEFSIFFLFTELFSIPLHWYSSRARVSYSSSLSMQFINVLSLQLNELKTHVLCED